MIVKILGYKISLEIVILIFVLYLVIMINALSSCCNGKSIAEGFETPGPISITPPSENVMLPWGNSRNIKNQAESEYAAMLAINTPRSKAEQERLAKNAAEIAARVKVEQEMLTKNAAESARAKAEQERLAKNAAEIAGRVKVEQEMLAKNAAEIAARSKAEQEMLAKNAAEISAGAARAKAEQDRLLAYQQKYYFNRGR